MYIKPFTPKKQNIHSFQMHMELSKIDHMEGQKTSLNKFKKTEIISNTFSDHNGLKLETNLKEKNSENIQIHGD